MRDYYGDNVTCILPGVKLDPALQLPVCNHYTMDPPKQMDLGLVNLMNPGSLPTDIVGLDDQSRAPRLSDPPIGTHLSQHVLYNLQ